MKVYKLKVIRVGLVPNQAPLFLLYVNKVLQGGGDWKDVLTRIQILKYHQAFNLLRVQIKE